MDHECQLSVLSGVTQEMYLTREESRVLKTVTCDQWFSLGTDSMLENYGAFMLKLNGSSDITKVESAGFYSQVLH